MSEESPVAKRARLQLDEDAAASKQALEAAAAALQAPADANGAAAAAANGAATHAAAGDGASSPVTTPSRRRRRTPSPRRYSTKTAEAAAGAGGAEAPAAAATAGTPVAAAAAAAGVVDVPAAAAAVKESAEDTPAAAELGSGATKPNAAGSNNASKQPAAAPAAKEQQEQQQEEPGSLANGSNGQQQQQQEQEQGQQKQQQQQQQMGKRAKRQQKFQSQSYQLTFGIHQCIKRDLPHEALHLYRAIKAAEPGSVVDPGTCSALLNLLVGKWQWELHQRHQHLLRAYTAAGRDTAPLDAAFASVVAAALAQREQQRDTGDGNILSKMTLPTGDAVPPEMVCHVEKHVELTLNEKLRDKSWLDGLLVDMPPDRPPLLELLHQAVSLVVSDLASGGQALDEQLYLQLARVAGITGDTDKAFGYVQQLVAGWSAGGPGSSSLTPRLRDFQPALVGYALTGQAGKAQEVVQLMLDCKLDLTEPEFALWLESIAAGGSYEQLAAALTATAGELNELRGTTVDLVERFFRSDRAAAALAPGGLLASLGKSSWQQQWVTPDNEGRVKEAGVTLQMSDLSESDWAAFAQQVRQLAEQQEKQQGKFKTFCDWLDHNGPFDVMIDGANVALWGENYEGGAFRPDKVKRMYDAVQEQNPGAKVLLVLHAGRHNDVRYNHRELFEWLEQLRKAGCFYVTPAGSNDDWYWMYAAVRAREHGLLVSNDQLRDHVWNLLRPKHMLKWTQRHLIRFTFNFEKTEVYLQYPLPYTPCVQHDAEKGVWLLPSVEKEQQWLCCRAV